MRATLRHGPVAPVLAPLGVALVAAGLVVAVLARALARHGQPTDPGRPTTRLVTSGVFAISRNPLYVGGAAVLAGIALTLDLPCALLSLLPALAAARLALVAPEERYLARTFGDEYARYAASVRRWLGRRGQRTR